MSLILNLLCFGEAVISKWRGLFKSGNICEPAFMRVDWRLLAVFIYIVAHWYQDSVLLLRPPWGRILGYPQSICRPDAG